MALSDDILFFLEKIKKIKKVEIFKKNYSKKWKNYFLDKKWDQFFSPKSSLPIWQKSSKKNILVFFLFVIFSRNFKFICIEAVSAHRYTEKISKIYSRRPPRFSKVIFSDFFFFLVFFFFWKKKSDTDVQFWGVFDGCNR